MERDVVVSKEIKYHQDRLSPCLISFIPLCWLYSLKPDIVGRVAVRKARLPIPSFLLFLSKESDSPILGQVLIQKSIMVIGSKYVQLLFL